MSSTGFVDPMQLASALAYFAAAHVALRYAYAHMDKPRTDIMAPDNEPTDEELSLVMHAALNAAMERKALSDEWMKRELERAVREAMARDHATKSR